MAVAVACCIVAYFNHEYNASFNYQHQHANQIYRISSAREFQENITHYAIAPMPLGNMVRSNITDVDRVCRISSVNINLRLDTEIFGSNTGFVDADFFTMFSLEFIAGHPDLQERSKIYISQSLAEKLFGVE